MSVSPSPTRSAARALKKIEDAMKRRISSTIRSTAAVRVARWYDRTTRKDLPEFRALAGRIAAQLPARGSSGSALEVAPGPGFLSIELARRGLQVRAVDISRTFVELARQNAAAAGVTAQFEVGDAAALPVADGSVDFVVCRAAFKNFAEPLQALREMRRVLRPGGTALLIDMRRDASVEEIRRYVDGLGVGWFNRLFMMATFRLMLVKRAYPIEEIRRMVRQAEWGELRIETSPMGFEAWMKK
jgi:ubiquinone/menaquinone biosynthesis C-methylase UbiE